jgi:dihydroorotate dehydrogenase (NAD+) catalytic subunit
VQVGTATFANPLAPLQVLEGLERYCCERGLSSVCELIGAGRAKSASPR